MMGVETIARIRFGHLQNCKGIKRIARELRLHATRSAMCCARRRRSSVKRTNRFKAMHAALKRPDRWRQS
jgi:hypothetical protein